MRRCPWTLTRLPSSVLLLGVGTRLTLVDIRMPGSPVGLLQSHDAAVNAVAWAPHSDSHICTVADDNQAFIWDVCSLPNTITEPILAYSAPGPVSSMVWNMAQTDWVAINVGKNVQMLRV